MSWWSKHVTHNLSSAAKKVGFRNMFDPTDPFKQLFDPNRKGGLAGLGKQYLNDFKDWYDGTAAQRKANQMNIENWQMQNEYNTPAAQMARYAAAGLNPNLIYSQSNEAGSIASVSPALSGGEQISKAAQTLASFYSIAGMIADVANKKQQNKNLATQDLLLSAQADYTYEMARRYAHDTNYFMSRDLPSSAGVPSYERMIQWLMKLLETRGTFRSLDNRMPGRKEVHTMDGRYFPVRY